MTLTLIYVVEVIILQQALRECEAFLERDIAGYLREAMSCPRSLLYLNDRYAKFYSQILCVINR